MRDNLTVSAQRKMAGRKTAADRCRWLLVAGRCRAARGSLHTFDDVPVGEQRGVVLERALHERVEHLHHASAASERGLESFRSAATLASMLRPVANGEQHGVRRGVELSDKVQRQ